MYRWYLLGNCWNSIFYWNCHSTVWRKFKNCSRRGFLHTQEWHNSRYIN